MRIIGGIAKSRRVRMDQRLEIRPISDRVKQSLFDILMYDIGGARFLDLFAGSGAVGIEALSRGAKESIFVDANGKCANLIKKNLNELGLRNSIVLLSDSFKAVESFRQQREKFDLIFIDPPYEKDLIKKSLKVLEDNDILTEKGYIIIKRHKKEAIETVLKIFDERRYGDTILTFIRK